MTFQNIDDTYLYFYLTADMWVNNSENNCTMFRVRTLINLIVFVTLEARPK